MKKKNIGLVGFGSVNSSLFKLLNDNHVLREQVEVTCILVRNKNKERPDTINNLLVYDVDSFLNHHFDIVMEASNDDEPAYTIIKTCLKNGIHVITANKKVVANHFFEFLELSHQNIVSFLFEASTLSGIPVIHSMMELIESDTILSMEGIVNGSTNYCLTASFKDHLSFEDSIHKAQELGYLESDPSQDLDGFDSLRKIVILSNIAYQTDLKLESVYRYPLSQVNSKMIEYLSQKKLVLKYIASSSRTTEGISCAVEPVAFNEDHLFARIDYETNSLRVLTKNRGILSWSGAGAGGIPTASGMISDLVQILYRTGILKKTINLLSQNAIFSLEKHRFIILKNNKFIETKPLTRQELLSLLPGADCYVRCD